MDDEIKYIEEKTPIETPKDNTNNVVINLPTWSIEPPLEIERKEDEL